MRFINCCNLSRNFFFALNYELNVSAQVTIIKHYAFWGLLSVEPLLEEIYLIYLVQAITSL